MIKNIFSETTADVFHTLQGYMVGDVKNGNDGTIIRFDKQVENVFLSRNVLLDNDGIHVTDDFVLDILPK